MWRLETNCCGKTHPPRNNCGVGALVNINGQKSHQLIVDSLRMLANLDHSGARGAEEQVGDGASMLLQKPDRFLRAEFPGLPACDRYGVGQFFLPRNTRRRDKIRAIGEGRDAARQIDIYLTGDSQLPPSLQTRNPPTEEFAP